MIGIEQISVKNILSSLYKPKDCCDFVDLVTNASEILSIDNWHESRALLRRLYGYRL